MTGILPIDKPAGITSFGAVARMRKILNIKKIGHAGTLDPMATGVLPILVGSATRFLEFLPCKDKRYSAVIQLGFTTDTLDTTGTILTRCDTTVTRPELDEAVSCFIGKIEQIPPMYSAVQKDGVRLYELARQGKEIDRNPRPVEIYKARILEYDESAREFVLDVSCSAGTYIRTLADDIGKKLGTGACLAGLRRTEGNGFTLARCYSFDEVEEYAAQGRIEKRIIPIEDVLSAYPAVYVSDKQAVRFSNGGELDLDRLKGNYESGLYRIFDREDVFLGLGEADTDTAVMRVKKVMSN
ncbi:MAG: tRNA pseudouridine(55) synthase TruB [Clostridia bacterium]|nr:tRNA pseudouridine(55) synthase TruB [Clostridia bacterium]